MASKKFQTEWIAAHLLFPNSAQARDIFSHVISSKVTTSVNIDPTEFYFQKLVNYFFKIQSVQSNLQFFEFEKEKIKLWPTYFKKLNKQEVALIIGHVIYGLSEKKLSVIVKIAPTLIHQKIKNAIYKIIPKQDMSKKIEYQFKFKKYNSKNKSDFFVYDEIVRCALDFNQAHNFSDQILESNIFKAYAHEIQNFIQELLSLKRVDYDIPIADHLISEDNLKNKSDTWWKKSIPLGFAMFIVMGILIYRPQFLQDLIDHKSIDTIELQQIKIDRQIEIDGHSEITELEHQTNKEMHSVPDVSAVSAITNNPVAAQKQDSAPTNITTNNKKENPKINVKEKEKEKEKSNGLYRGRLIVTDISKVVDVAREKIVSLGGQKAGQVELGWMKNQETSYFHFIFPNEKKSELEDYLKQYGVLELTFERHSRTVPQGFKRYIIEIKQNE
jgi:hypothetical protein